MFPSTSKVAVNGNIIHKWKEVSEPYAPLITKSTASEGTGVRFGHQMPGYFGVAQTLNGEKAASQGVEEKEQIKMLPSEGANNAKQAASQGVEEKEESGNNEEPNLMAKDKNEPNLIPNEFVQTIILVVKGTSQTKYAKNTQRTYMNLSGMCCPWIFVGQTALPENKHIFDGTGKGSAVLLVSIPSLSSLFNGKIGTNRLVKGESIRAMASAFSEAATLCGILAAGLGQQLY